ncbi:aldo/keto reductase [Roseomonas sp. BN140053]|uniref:aldo/keto reductase n=1 Tax=Roseomonas sp. BN140053 TaxID=3391898 RepID=UPI0039E9BC19
MRTQRRTLLSAALAAGLPPLRPGGAAAQQGAPLLRKPIPSSGETIPALGLGTARRYEDVKSDAEIPPLRDTVARFAAGGGTVIDTSPTYGTAEEVIGKIVEGLGIRNQLFLATKVSISGREQGVAQIEQSFRRLRTDKIDLLAVHNLRDTEIHLRTLRDLKAAGRIRYVGLTTSFERQYEEFEAVMRREQVDFIQVDYALDNRKTAERIIPLAADRGMAVMLNLPFGRGRLFEAVRDKQLPDWAAEYDIASWAQFFLKYLVSHPAVTCPAPGMAQARYVDDNLAAARGRMPDAAGRRRMEAFIDGL